MDVEMTPGEDVEKADAVSAADPRLEMASATVRGRMVDVYCIVEYAVCVVDVYVVRT